MKFSMVSLTDKKIKSGYSKLVSDKILPSHTSDSVLLVIKYLFFILLYISKKLCEFTF